MTALKNLTDNLKSRADHAKKSVTRKVGHWTSHGQKSKQKRMKKSEESLRDLRDTLKTNNNHVVGIPKEKGRESIF